MNLTFNINLNPMGIPLASVRSSMQLDSGICLASLEVDGWKLYLEVRGDVRVDFNPDPKGSHEDGQVYRQASDFPPELARIFADGTDIYTLPNVYVDDNNWFELFVEKDGRFVNSDLVDEGCFCAEPKGPAASPAAILGVMYDTYLAYKKDIEDRMKALAEAIPFFRGKVDELKALVKVEEECGSYPHDTITTNTVEYAHEGEPTLFAELRTYMDRDGGEEDPDMRIWVNGFTTTDKDIEAIVNEVFGF